MKKALMIGINNYPTSQLDGCINDATSLKAILETNSDGTPNFDARLANDVQTKSEMRRMIDELFAGDCETALFYFAGHGYFNNLGGYIVTPDATKYDEGISMDEILEMANSSKIKNKIIILDCCYSGYIGSTTKNSGKFVSITEGVTILTASKENETSDEINGHGLFTSLLLDALQGGAADLQGNITPGSVYAYIDKALGPWKQRPVFKTNVTGFNSLRNVTPQVPMEILRKIIEYFPSPQDQFSLDPSFEDTNDPKVEHKVIEPYAKKENVEKFKHLQKLQSIGLIIPVDSPYMYFATINSKSCKLTSLGYHYWKLLKEKRI